MKKVALLSLFTILSVRLFAGGYAVGIQAQKNIGMGHIGTGLYLDAGSLFFNPGALCEQKNKMSFVLGVSPLFSTGYYKNQQTGNEAETNNDLGTPSSFYFSYKISEKLIAGFGFYTPFGSGVKWPNRWDGQLLITSVKLKTYFFQPTLSYKISDKVSIGAGFVIATGDVELKKAFPIAQNVYGDVTLDGKPKTGFGYNVGLYVKPTEKLSLGLSYRSKIDMEVEGGDATFKTPQGAMKDKFSASLPMISSVNFGMAYRFTPKLTVAVDLNYNEWGVYKSLDVAFEKNTKASNSQERDYESTLTTRIGVSYAFTDGIVGRAGYYYDPSPVQKYKFSPETPSMHNHGFTLGGSLRATNRLSIDLSLLVINGQERSVGYKKAGFYGNFRTFVVSPGIGLSYKL